MNEINIAAASAAEHGLLFRLLQFYYFEASHWSGEDVLADGRYDSCEDGVRSYLEGGERRALLARVDGHPAGFALIEPAEGLPAGTLELADLFVLPKYRNKGVAQAMLARTILQPGTPWLIAIFKQDQAAQHYWQRTFLRLPSGTVQALIEEDDDRFDLFLLHAPAPAQDPVLTVE